MPSPCPTEPRASDRARRRRRWAWACALLVGTLVAVGCDPAPDANPWPSGGGTTESPAVAPTTVAPVTAAKPQPATTTTSKLVPAKGALFGGNYKPAAWDTVTWQNEVTGVEGRIGRTVDIVHTYRGFSAAWPTAFDRWVASSGRRLMVSWAGLSDTDGIAAGRYDSTLTERADAVKALGAPVFVRWFWEMNQTIDGVKPSSPQSFVQAWKHVRAVFAQRGATNAVWVWCPTAWGFVTGTAQQYYPGAASVDWVCADGYNWAPTKPGAAWRTFADIFAGFYAWAAPTGKPLMIGEAGALENLPGQKGAWLDAARTTMKTAMPAIKAFVYYDADHVEPDGLTYDWRVDTSATSLAAYRTMALDPYFLNH